MSNLNKIRLQSLKEIRPTESDIQQSFDVFKKVKNAIQEEASARNIDLSFIELEGSSGQKQTQLRNWNELDIFVGLPLTILRQNQLEDKVRKPAIRHLIKQLVRDVAVNAVERVDAKNIQVAYAEHPYVIAHIDKQKVDVVFCFDLPEDYIYKHGPITAVDRTPHHSKFVKKNLSEAQRDDVRLLKAFFQSSFVYGDSSPIGRSGFTGFSSEMLIFHRHTLEATLDFLSQPDPEPLDFFNRDHDILKHKFSQDFLIISDPIDPNRNISSSISNRAYRFAQHNASQLLQKPTKKYFKRKPVPQLSPNEMEKLEPHYYVIEFQDLTDWHYTKTRDKLYRYFTTLSKYLKQEPTGEPRFGMMTFEEVFQEKVFAVSLHIEKAEISPSFIRTGPPAAHTEGVKQFVERHPNAYFKDGRYHVEIRRAVTKAEEAIRNYLKKHIISSNLQVIGITKEGTTKIGRQALWILINAVLPFSKSNPR